MTTKVLIQAEIERVNEEDLDELYRVISTFVQSREQEQDTGQDIMSRLMRIKIEAPADFSTNLDLYMSGELDERQNLR